MAYEFGNHGWSTPPCEGPAGTGRAHPDEAGVAGRARTGVMADVDFNQPVVVTYNGEKPNALIRFDNLRVALHSIFADFAPEALPSAFICTRQGGLNIVEIRDLYRSLCEMYEDGV